MNTKLKRLYLRKKHNRESIIEDIANMYNLTSYSIMEYRYRPDSSDLYNLLMAHGILVYQVQGKNREGA